MRSLEAEAEESRVALVKVGGTFLDDDAIYGAPLARFARRVWVSIAAT